MNRRAGMWRKRLLTLGAAVLWCTVSGQAALTQTLRCEGAAAYGLNIDAALAAAVVTLADASGRQLTVYCADPALAMQKGSLYAVMTPHTAGERYAQCADALGGVLARGVPETSLDKLRESCGIADLTLQEAITATQLAVWSLTQGYMQYMGEERVDTVVTWLLLGESDTHGADVLRVYWPLEPGLQPLVGLA